jgi:hypothetical protein
MVARTRLNVTLYVHCLSRITQTDSVYCAVRTGSISKTKYDSCLKGREGLEFEVERRNVRCAVIFVNSSELFGDAAMAMSFLDSKWLCIHQGVAFRRVHQIHGTK